MEFCYDNQNQGLIISVVRKTMPSIRQTVLRDFLEILHENGWYRVREHNKKDSTYTLFGNLFEFFSVDQAQKVRGSKRHILFCNEANELLWDEFFQLNIRTKIKAIIDFNPTIEENHWIWKKLVVREDAGYYLSTYKDNPFLTKREIKEIENLQETDLHYWTIFGLGQRAQNPALIFKYHTTPIIPPKAKLLGYGMDFGFSNDPTALIAVYKLGNELYFNELLYEHEMTVDDINFNLFNLGIKTYDKIIADSSDPRTIEDLKRKGWRVLPSKKGRDSIVYGIDLLKRYKLYITTSSTNLIKEFSLYKWKQYPDGTMSNSPVDAYNHGIDGLRYLAEHTLRSKGKYLIS